MLRVEVTSPESCKISASGMSPVGFCTDRAGHESPELPPTPSESSSCSSDIDSGEEFNFFLQCEQQEWFFNHRMVARHVFTLLRILLRAGKFHFAAQSPS